MTRRFFTSLAMASVLRATERERRGLPGLPHFPPKAKRVIYLFQSGGPSQIELFDYKPRLLEPLPVLVHQRDVGDGRAEQPARDPRDPIETVLGGRIEEPQLLHGLQPFLLVGRDRGFDHAP